MPRLLAVSGMMGSGKTTLARNLARLLGWSYLPESRHAISFLPDLFRDQRRWAFETQVSFLAEKALQILRNSEQGLDGVLDRSLFEDVFIFGKHFVENGYIDRRSAETYDRLAHHFLASTPSPAALIYCKCDPSVLSERIKSRGNQFASLYPPGHLEEIGLRYEHWIRTFSGCPVYSVQSDVVDFRGPDGARQVLDGLASEMEVSNKTQGDLFGDSPARGAHDGRGHGGVWEARGKAKSNELVAPAYPYAYIAAPFTGVATAHGARASGDRELFHTTEPHGVIEKGSYRTALTKLAGRLEKLGLNSLLPHRDVNKWGKRLLNAATVVDLCTEHVRGCDIFVGVLGQSFGSHYEFGLARALRKPSILIRCDEIGESFIASGMRDGERLIEYKCTSVREIPAVIDLKIVREFINSHLRWGR